MKAIYKSAIKSTLKLYLGILAFLLILLAFALRDNNGLGQVLLIIVLLSLPVMILYSLLITILAAKRTAKQTGDAATGASGPHQLRNAVIFTLMIIFLIA